MKDNTRILYHINKEIKTEKPATTFFIHRSVGDNELLPAKKVHMEIVRDKDPMLDTITKAVRRFIKKYWFSRL